MTQDDITHRRQYLNARHTFDKILSYGAIPIVNENDSVAVEEIRWGDNDTLSALVTMLTQSHLLILLTDSEGLCTGDPRFDKKARVISEVEMITPEIEKLAGKAGTKMGSGGMNSKIEAAKIAQFCGSATVIAYGRKGNIIEKIVTGETVGTFFPPSKKKVSSRKSWIAFGQVVKGKIVIDDGAREALYKRGKSLLPAGIVECHGDFKAGEAVEVIDLKGEIIARGLSNYHAREIRKIKGLKTEEVSQRLRDAFGEEVIHRDCLIILR